MARLLFRSVGIAASLLVLASAGCTGAVDPNPLAPDYSLTSLGGRSLPREPPAGALGSSLIAGSLHLKDGMFEERFHEQNDGTNTITYRRGSYSVDGDRLILEAQEDGFSYRHVLQISNGGGLLMTVERQLSPGTLDLLLFEYRAE